MKEIKFEKWQGLGNDFIILNEEKATSELAKLMCDRNFGVGADGLFSPVKTDDTDIGWDFYNSDGSIAQMCGNGIRCFAKYAYTHKLVNKNKFSVKTLAGTIIPEILSDGRVRVDMGKPILEAQKIPVNTQTPQDFIIEGFSASAISMGNPHCIIFTEHDSAALAREYGPKIEPHKLFPQKTSTRNGTEPDWRTYVCIRIRNFSQNSCATPPGGLNCMKGNSRRFPFRNLSDASVYILILLRLSLVCL